MVARINPLNEDQFGRLQKSIDWSNRELEFPRQKRVENIKQLVGYHYSTQGSAKRVPVNLTKLITSIFIRLLAARAPRALISTKIQELKSTAANLEIAVNLIPGEIKLQETFKRVVMEALFSSGWAKVGLHSVGEMLGHSVGAPFVDVITLDDLIIDMVAKHIDQIQYIGNDYWMNYKDVMESKWFPEKSRNGLEPDEYTVIGEAGEDRAEGISQSESAEPFKKKVHLRDVWLPAEGLMVTYGVTTKKRMKVIEWTGPERGPYYGLGFGNVPGNLLPLPPISVWHDLHEMVNILYRKLSDQADAQKTVQGFQGDEEGVTAFKNAVDGDGISYHGQEPKLLKAGGVDAGNLAFFLQSRDLTSWIAGNIDSLGGLSPQAETLGQDKLLSEASNAQLREMASDVVDFAKEIFGALAYYEWHDPARRRELEKKIPGTDFGIVVPWDRSARRGKFGMYVLDIDVYSHQDDSPSLKLQKLGMIFERFVTPLMPLIQQPGGPLDVQRILKDIAKFADFPELNEWFQFMQDQQPEAGGEVAQKPSSTTRTNVRVNRPGATESGKSQILQQALLGGQPQGAEMASLNRPTG